MRQVIVRTVTLFAIGMVSGIIINALRAEAVPWYPKQAKDSCEVTGVPIEEVTPEIASSICADQRTVIVDVREEAIYREGHIPDALHLPCQRGAFTDKAGETLQQANVVLVYGQDTRSAMHVAISLQQKELSVRVLKGGYPAWEASGLACASGPCEGCLEKHYHE